MQKKGATTKILLISASMPLSAFYYFQNEKENISKLYQIHTEKLKLSTQNIVNPGKQREKKEKRKTISSLFR